MGKCTVVIVCLGLSTVNKHLSGCVCVRWSRCYCHCVLQEIYLEKNGTSQLGVTLGYDTKSPKGQLYVCEVRIVCTSIPMLYVSQP